MPSKRAQTRVDRSVTEQFHLMCPVIRRIRTLSIDRSRSVDIKNVSQHSQTHWHHEDRVTGSWVIFSIFEVKICEK